MKPTEFIPIDLFCEHHQVSLAFVTTMHDAGWIKIIEVNDIRYIDQQELPVAERLARLSIDLQINPEGIDVIMSLLERIKQTQSEVTRLKQRLSLYEDQDVVTGI
jgi:hypothetical protein